MTDKRTKVERKAARILQAGERVVAATRATVETPAVAALGGLVLQMVFVSEAKTKAREAGLDVAVHMTVALTDRRLLILRRSSMSRRSPVLSSAPASAVKEVEVHRKGVRTLLTFRFHHRPAVTFIAYRGDRRGSFVQAFRQLAVRCRRWQRPQVPRASPLRHLLWHRAQPNHPSPQPTGGERAPVTLAKARL